MAATFVSLPFFVVTVEAALRGVDRRYEDAARTLGASSGHGAASGDAAVDPGRPGRGRGAGVGPGPGRVRRDDHVRRQLRAAAPRRCRSRSTRPSTPTCEAAILLSLVLLAVSVAVLAALRDRWLAAPLPLAAPPQCRRRPTGCASWDREAALLLDVDLTSPPARPWRSSDRTGPARPRCCGCSPGSTRWRLARCGWADRVLDDPQRGIRRAAGGALPRRRVPGPPAVRAPRCGGQRRLRAAVGWRSGGATPAGRPRAGSTRSASDGRADSRPAELSGGEAQRVALARALAPRPPALLLDEPLSALDADVRAAVRRQLAEHLRAHTGPCLVVTHDPLDAAVLADRVVVLEDGLVTAQGSLADLVARPRTAWAAELAGTNLLRASATGTHLVLDGRRRPGRCGGRRPMAMSWSPSGRPPWRCTGPIPRAAPATCGRPPSPRWRATPSGCGCAWPGRSPWWRR